MNFGHVVAQKSDERRNSSELPRFGLDGIIHVAKMLKVGGRVGLDDAVGVAQELDYLVKVGIPPVNARNS
jgi:hypothetical protein